MTHLCTKVFWNCKPNSVILPWFGISSFYYVKKDKVLPCCWYFHTKISQQTFTCLKLTLKTLRRCGTCSKLTKTILKRRQRRRSDVFIVNVEYILHPFLLFPSFDLQQVNFYWAYPRILVLSAFKCFCNSPQPYLHLVFRYFSRQSVDNQYAISRQSVDNQ